MNDRRRWNHQERIVCARLLAELARRPSTRDPALLVAIAMRGLAEALIDARRWDEAELVRSCARALELADDARR